MLAYLDALLTALAARDIAEIDRLLAHPLARILSAEALEDATAERRAAGTGMPCGTPLRLLQLRYRTAQLLSERIVADAPEVGAPAAAASAPKRNAAWAERRPAARHQMELPLSA
jgi:hypothetical protein